MVFICRGGAGHPNQPQATVLSLNTLEAQFHWVFIDLDDLRVQMTNESAEGTGRAVPLQAAAANTMKPCEDTTERNLYNEEQLAPDCAERAGRTCTNAPEKTCIDRTLQTVSKQKGALIPQQKRSSQGGFKVSLLGFRFH